MVQERVAVNMVWTGFICSGARSCEHGIKCYSSIKDGQFAWLIHNQFL